MTARRAGVCVCVVVMFTGASWAADMMEGSASAGPSTMASAVAVATVETETPTVYIHPNMPADVREKLQTAVKIAAERIEELEACGGMFANLGADGLEMLNTTLYFPARALNKMNGVCRRSAAYTTVGGKSTFVCPEFSNLSDERAAMFVVHEALHHAGLSEKPLDRRGMTSLQINAMVANKCRF